MLYTYDVIFALHLSIHDTVGVFPYGFNELEPVVAMVWHNRNSGREDILTQLLTFMNSEVHQ